MAGVAGFAAVALVITFAVALRQWRLPLASPP